MTVYFAYRSYDLGPTGKYLKRFDDDTVLAWFQRHWDHLALGDDDDIDEADERLTSLLGCDGWFLWNPFRYAASQGIPVPADGDALRELLGGHVEQLAGSAHALQIFTEEDGEGGALFYFDDHFLSESAGLAAYLLHEDWRLPSGSGDGDFVPAVEVLDLSPVGAGSGATYLLPLERRSKYPLDDVAPAYRVPGVRVPDLARYLCNLPPAGKNDDWHSRLRQFPALMLAPGETDEPMDAAFLQSIREAPDDELHWSAWADWREDHDAEAPGLYLLRRGMERFARLPGPAQEKLPQAGNLVAMCQSLLDLEAKHAAQLRTTQHSLFHIEDHLAQACLDVSWDEPEPYFGQWIFFDDRWASAHPEMANALLRFSARWDVLTGE